MWILIFDNTGKKFPLLIDKLYTIGRKDTDIVITDDSSISRKHGTIKITVVNNLFVVTITDSSKFGSYFAKNSKDTSFTKVADSATLNSGDFIRIGVQHTTCQLLYEPLVVVTSMMDQKSQSNLQTVLFELGGKLVTSWQADATHLVTSKIILNIKVTLALANACSIVKETYFDELLKSVKAKMQLPSEKDFVPTVGDEGLNVDALSFLPNLSRKTLFKDRVFVFSSSKQAKRLGLTCRAAGGTVKMILEISKIELRQFIDNPSVTVFLSETVSGSVDAKKLIDDLGDQLIAKNCRFVQEHEIGLALLYCSIDVYTNPEFDLTNDIVFTQGAMSSVAFSEALGGKETLASDSQQNTLFISRVQETILPEDSVKCTSKKRVCCDDNASNEMDSLSCEPPAKLIKSEKEFITEDIDFLSNIVSDSHNRKVKPPPTYKRKFDQVKENIEMNKRQCRVELDKDSCTSFMKPSQKDGVSNFQDVPDSCIDDDSLWSCKVDSQEGEAICDEVAPVKDSNVAAKLHDRKPTEDHVNVKTKPRTHEDYCGKKTFVSDVMGISNISIKTEPITQEKHIVKRAFAPATVPDDVDDMNGNAPKLDPDLPYSGVSIVVHVPLVKPKVNESSLPKSSHASVFSSNKNFKKFVKVVHAYKNPGSQTNFRSVEPPRIVGGRDLLKHVNRIEKDADIAQFVHDWSKLNDKSVHGDSDDSNPFA